MKRLLLSLGIGLVLIGCVADAVAETPLFSKGWIAVVDTPAVYLGFRATDVDSGEKAGNYWHGLWSLPTKAYDNTAKQTKNLIYYKVTFFNFVPNATYTGKTITDSTVTVLCVGQAGYAYNEAMRADSIAVYIVPEAAITPPCSLGIFTQGWAENACDRLGGGGR